MVSIICIVQRKTIIPFVLFTLCSNDQLLHLFIQILIYLYIIIQINY